MVDIIVKIYNNFIINCDKGFYEIFDINWKRCSRKNDGWARTDKNHRNEVIPWTYDS
jgi:hypothetical protein